MMVNLGEDHVKQYIALEALITKKYMHYSISLATSIAKPVSVVKM